MDDGLLVEVELGERLELKPSWAAPSSACRGIYRRLSSSSKYRRIASRTISASLLGGPREFQGINDLDFDHWIIYPRGRYFQGWERVSLRVS